VDNAVKYSSAGSEVRVHASAYDGRIRVDVQDHGPGIPLEDQSLIFEKFARSGGGAAKPCTGLGLFIARSIVEAHGGWLDVESQPDEGSTFTVELPIGE
jgi:signal transduction histidine kinase